jgi:ubiquitin-protein ligase
MISFKRIVFFVRGYLDRGELEKAEVCLMIIKKYFSKIWGVQAIVKKLEQDLVSVKSRTGISAKDG